VPNAASIPYLLLCMALRQLLSIRSSLLSNRSVRQRTKSVRQRTALWMIQGRKGLTGVRLIESWISSMFVPHPKIVGTAQRPTDRSRGRYRDRNRNPESKRQSDTESDCDPDSDSSVSCVNVNCQAWKI